MEKIWISYQFHESYECPWRLQSSKLSWAIGHPLKNCNRETLKSPPGWEGFLLQITMVSHKNPFRFFFWMEITRSWTLFVATISHPFLDVRTAENPTIPLRQSCQVESQQSSPKFAAPGMTFFQQTKRPRASWSAKENMCLPTPRIVAKGNSQKEHSQNLKVF